MAKADMFILPSYFDANPCVLYEAMASGTLTCAANIYGPPEIITHLKTGLLFEPKSADSIASTILYAINNPEQISEIIQKGLDWVKSNTWEQSAKNLQTAYQKMLKEK